MDRFFISGCQRSGTTMLRLILESHPSIQCFDEAAGYDLLVRESKGEGNEFLVKEGAGLLGFKVPRFAEQLTWSEFSDPVYGVFPSFYQDQKVIHVLRNALDVVGSMMRLKAHGETSWLDRYGLSILQALIHHPNINAIFKKKYETLECQGLPIHLVGALYWEIKNQGFFDLLGRNKPIYAVRYESLVGSPRSELLKLSQFLGVDWDDSLLNHPEHPHAELDENGIAIGETDPRRSIDTQSIGRYRHLMTEQQIQEVRYYTEDFSNKITQVLPR
ncbi:sulfotransferase [Methylobacter sp.]|uniref:sulfotransferase family protein n=1 Tax=Methylobacter sp. TaxID=2051955 RepID=UPI0024889228|nr:sulfotransferase [Methylobacter sp.]MDI1276630.1 sulfotransferase [Methylobacter sp.]MDI1357263.1 sulfotransferase [Methylobacter sp.]